MVRMPVGYFRKAVGDTPQPIVSIQRAGITSNTAVRSDKPHGLSKGDVVLFKLTGASSEATFNKYSNRFAVTNVGSSNPLSILFPTSRDNDSFMIAVPFEKGEYINGTWQLASSVVPPVNCPDGYEKNSYGDCVASTFNCPDGYTKDSTGACIGNLTGCPAGSIKDSSGNCVSTAGPSSSLPSWAIWVGVGVAAIIGVVAVVKARKK